MGSPVEPRLSVAGRPEGGREGRPVDPGASRLGPSGAAAALPPGARPPRRSPPIKDDKRERQRGRWAQGGGAKINFSSISACAGLS